MSAAFIGLEIVPLMTASRNKLTVDELSRGRRHWLDQKARAYRLFSRTVGDSQLQSILDYVGKCDEEAGRCVTYYPCSRAIFLPQA